MLSETKFLKIKLMLPYQTNKEIMFNEAIHTIDAALNPHAQDIIFQPLEKKPTSTEKYLYQGSYCCEIYYALEKDIRWRVMEAKPGMIFWVKSLKGYVVCDGEKWQQMPFLPHDLREFKEAYKQLINTEITKEINSYLE